MVEWSCSASKGANDAYRKRCRATAEEAEDLGVTKAFPSEVVDRTIPSLQGLLQGLPMLHGRWVFSIETFAVLRVCLSLELEALGGHWGRKRCD